MKAMTNTTLADIEQLSAQIAKSDPSISVGEINVQGNVDGSIVVGNRNVIGNNNVIYEINTTYGAFINLHAAPPITRRAISPPPPRLPSGFIGREQELKALEGYIRNKEAVLIYGHSGMGKTALLKKVANTEVAKSMQDGVLYLEEAAEGGIMGLQDIQQRAFDKLFVSNPPTKLTDSIVEANLATTSPLVILDEWSFNPGVLRWLPGLFPAGAILVASPINLIIDEEFEYIQLAPLSHEQAIRLFTGKSGVAADETARQVIDQICLILEDVPLAITTIANAIRQKRLQLNQVVDGLMGLEPQPPSRDNDKLQAAIERSFGLLYLYLSEQERGMLVMVAAAPGKSVRREWLESLEGGKTTCQALEDLEVLYANSPRLRLPEGIRHVIQRGRTGLVARLDVLIRDLINELKRDDQYLNPKYVADELGNILGLFTWAFTAQRWDDVIELGRAVDPYLTLHGLWETWGYVLAEVQIAGQNIKDDALRASVEGWVLHQLGTREIGFGSDRNQAINLLKQALGIRIKNGDIRGAKYTLHNLRILFGPPPKSDPKPPKNGSDPPPPGSNLVDILQTYWDKLKPVFVKYGVAIAAAIVIGLAAVSSVLAQPSLKLTEQANPTKYNHSGQVIEYSYIVDNPGFRPVPGPISVNDDPIKVKCPDLSNIGNGNTSLDWNETLTCTGFYTVTDEDIQNGSLPNEKKASAAGRDEKSRSESRSESTAVPFDENYLTLTLQAQPQTYANSGQIITIVYIISNKGATTLNGPIKITDDNQLQINCPDLSNSDSSSVVIKAGESLTCVATYTITDTDIKNGYITNSASASAGEINSESKSITVYRIPQPTPNQILPSDRELSSPTLFQSADRQTYQTAGEQVAYTYAILNQGNAPMSGPVVVKDNITEVKCPDVKRVGNQNDVLDPGEIITCTSTYTITDADVKNGSVTNTAVAYAGDRNSEPQSVTIYSRVEPSNLILSTFAKPETYQEVGQKIEYTYLVTNDDRYPLNGPVTLRDDKTMVNCPELNTIGDGDSVLDPSERLACTAIYTITDLDIQNGSVTNTVQANTDGINSNPASSTVNEQTLNLAISADPETYQTAGDTLTYTYTITGKSRKPLVGPVTIAGNTLQTRCQDVKEVGNGDSFLDWNETVTCSSQYSITQADIDTAQPGSDRGAVTITASATVDSINSKEATVTILGPVQQRALSLAVTTDPANFSDVDQKITYTYVITNAGNVTILSPFQITDDHVDNGTPFNCGADTQQLAPKSSATCTRSYTIAQDDFGPKSVTNTATASSVYLEQLISSTATTTITCQSAAGWFLYTVDPQESLDHIVTWYPNTTMVDLQKANCMGSVSNINAGQALYVPAQPPSATISGFIRDTNGQPLSYTPVTLINNANGAYLTTYTGGNGEYIFSELGPGTYRIFQILITVRRGDTQSQNFTIIAGTP
jgi:hypothetical protein